MTNLNTLEKFLLIAQNPENRPFVSDLHINFGLVAATLLELKMNKIIQLNRDKVEWVDCDKVTDPVLMDVFNIIKKSKKPQQLKWLVLKLFDRSLKYKQLVLDQLYQKGLIRTEERRIFGILINKRYYLFNIKFRNCLIAQLKESVLYKLDLNDEVISVLGLIKACRLYDKMSFDKNELKVFKRELQNIISESDISEIINITAQEIQNKVRVAMSSATSKVFGARITTPKLG